MSVSFPRRAAMQLYVPCISSFHAPKPRDFSKVLVSANTAQRPLTTKSVYISSRIEESTNKTHRMGGMLFGSILIAIPFAAHAFNQKAVKKVDGVQLDDLAKTLKPITDHAACLVHLYRWGLRKKRPIIIGLTGCTGAGKSTLAKELRELLWKIGLKTEILHGDHCLNPVAPPHALPIHPHFDHLIAHRMLKQIIKGDRWIEKPIYAWDAIAEKSVVTKETLDTQGVEVWLFECQYSAFDERTYDLNKYADFHILLDAPTELATAWVWKRQRKIPEGTNREEYLAEVSSSIERYKEYLAPVVKKMQYILTPDAQHHLTLKQNKISENESFFEEMFIRDI